MRKYHPTIAQTFHVLLTVFVFICILEYGVDVVYLYKFIQPSKYDNMSNVSMVQLPYRHLNKSVAYSNLQLQEKIISMETTTRKQLPMFNQTGGLIIFLHIAKTGGSTIREGFRKLPNIKVKRITNEEQLIRKRDSFDWYVSSKNNKLTSTDGKEKTLLLEIHGNHGEPMTIYQIQPYLNHWRNQAQLNKKNLFVFTLIREPASFHVSYFTFFRHPNCHEFWCDRPGLPQTEQYLIESMIPNHQCQYLARSYNKTSFNVPSVTQPECESLYTELQNNVDWIGTTETLHKTTLPLLTYIVAGNVSIAQTFAIMNKQNVLKKLQLHDVSDTVKQAIRNISSLDRYLYDIVRRKYNLDMWRDFPMR